MKPFSKLLIIPICFTGMLANAQTASNSTDDQTQIRQVIEGETRAYQTAKPDQMLRSWAADKPYAERQGSEVKPFANGMPYLKGDALRRSLDVLKTMLKDQGHTLQISDYESHLNGNMAWATYSQQVMDKAGAVTDKSRQVRILERQPDGWKIVFMGTQQMN